MLKKQADNSIFYFSGEKLVSPRTQLRFTFREFTNFLVNGSAMFAMPTTPAAATSSPSSNVETLAFNRLSYHWAPYWKECSLCSDLTKPQMVIHMETLQEDLDLLLDRLNLPRQPFPVTHSQRGGHSSSADVVQKYFSTLLKSDVRQLYEMYRLDHELFGYTPDQYLDYAMDDP